MKHLAFYIMLIIPFLAFGQEERRYIRDGYKAYMDEDYDNAEVSFRKAEEVNDASYLARYNTSTALYQQNRLQEAGERLGELLAETNEAEEQAKLLHNLGNVLLESQKYQESVEAFKQSLRLNPGDEDTRYNLAYALQKLKEQQNQEQQNQDQQNQDKQNQDQQNQDQQNQDQQNQEQQNQEQQNQDQQQEQEQEGQQSQPQQMSQEEAERLLKAILEREKDVKERVDQEKVAGTRVKTDKDW